MGTFYYDRDVDSSLIAGRRVAIIGYGAQGHAHALNLRDSGVDVRVGLRPDSPSWQKAEGRGLRVLPTPEAAAEADVVAMLVPDTDQAAVYEHDIAPHLRAGDALVFAHGFAVHHDLVRPRDDVDVVLVAPKGPGHLLRRTYVDGTGVPSLVAVRTDATGKAHALALAYGAALGSARAGLLDTTFGEETETDLFGEQAVICGGIAALMSAGFDTLVAAGYQPEVAYFECVHEMKFVVDLIYQHGLAGMWYAISTTAEYGAYTRGSNVVGEQARDAMRRMLDDIRAGRFANELLADHASGWESLRALRAEAADHPAEDIGVFIRDHLPTAAAERGALHAASGG